ncbi:hypothetical protein OPV22_006665 [Ensete ventricosum]|uniref:DUF506 domain-containing protein n=1 Tax=Ensete ventricosum TaxID=4639 RepID=A0AAV8RNK4_ENSVE|nr:hypothetical protein OPV22_006665 [Ensete ventricosum]
MLLAREFGVWVGEAPSAPALARRWPAKQCPRALDRRPVGGSPGGGEDDCRICTATADMWASRLNGGEGRDVICQSGGFSHESEHDLAVMVSDFLENGSGSAESRHSSDSDSRFSELAHLAEKVLLYKRAVTQYENDLQSVVGSLLFSIDEVDLYLVKEEQGNAGCIRQSLVKLLKVSGYDAALCSSRWQGFDKVPGGDHEYIDVVVSDGGDSERLIIDIDFRSHFEIARAVESYDAILSSLPVVFVGSCSRLKQILQVMADAAKFSLDLNSMPLPPWRSLAYLQAKWCSKYERKHNVDKKNQQTCSSDHRRCVGHLHRLKASLELEIESERLLKPATNDKKQIIKSERRRLSLRSC